MARYDLSATEWRVIALLRPDKLRDVTDVDDRRIVNAIFHLRRSILPGAVCWALPPSTMAYHRDNGWPVPASGSVSSRHWRRARRSRSLHRLLCHPRSAACNGE